MDSPRSLHEELSASESTSPQAVLEKASSVSLSKPVDGMPTKRGPGKVVKRKPKASRLKGCYSNAYRLLLNAEIQDAASQSIKGDKYEPLRPSQIGISRWTSSEKEIFFSALSRVGKNDVRAIAARIRTKSPLEVQQYLNLLRRGVEEQSLDGSRSHLAGFTDVPAASEVSEECCKALEIASDALAMRQERHEMSRYKNSYRWLVTIGILDTLEQSHHVDTSDTDDNKAIEDLRQQDEKMLNYRNWIELSVRVFMNHGRSRIQENWQSIIEPPDEVGITQTAFKDFHTLAVSITKRLVSATLFCATSRLRALDTSAFHSVAVIKVGDVEAAAKILGLELNSHEFWVGAARRCSLNVYRHIMGEASKEIPMDYGEVEQILRESTRPSRQSSLSRAEDGKAAGQSEPVSSEPDLDSDNDELHTTEIGDGVSGLDDEDSQDDNGSSSPRDVPFFRNLAAEYMATLDNGPLDPSDSEFASREKRAQRTKNTLRAKEQLENAQLHYAETFDMQASLIEEQRLWNTIKQDPPFTIKPEEIELPRQLPADRKDASDLLDWRDRVEYRSQWETYERPLRTSAFDVLSTRRGRSRSESSIGTTRSEGNTNGLGEVEGTFLRQSLVSVNSDGFENDEDFESNDSAEDFMMHTNDEMQGRETSESP